MATLFVFLALVGYAATVSVFFREIRENHHNQQRTEMISVIDRLPGSPHSIWALAVLFHGIYLSLVLYTQSGLDLNILNAFSMIALLLSAMLLFTSLRQAIPSIVLIVLSLTCIPTLLFQALIPGINPHLINGAIGIKIHILVSLLAYAVLMFAAIQAIAVAYQNYHLHHHQLTGWVRLLPPLQHMENLLFILIATGFLLLSGALVSGFLFLDDLFAQHLVHKTLLALLAWGLFGTLLAGRWLFGWRGKTATHWTLWGFVLLMLAYFGSKLVLEIILSR